MGLPRFEPLSGVIGGGNTDFTTSVPYAAGTTAVYLNGQLLLSRAGNPWAEQDPSTGLIRITEPACVPRIGDEVAAFYMDASGDSLVQEIQPLVGVVEGPVALDGSIVREALAGSLAFSADLSGTLAPVELEGTVEPALDLTGLLKEYN